MSRKRRNQAQREAFEELQQRKKRKLEGEPQYRESEEDARVRRRRKSSNKKNSNRKNARRRGRAKPHKVGLTLVTIQAIVSMLCVGMLHIICLLYTSPSPRDQR